MANIGKRIKEIEVAPSTVPDPTYVPEEPAAPRVPETPKEPAKTCATMLS